ncbi:hypothetical protein AVEN_88101-1 [Araneus ventricosus]|uniref:Uncharacterized protein n=1 Tax=Araneus ventricosus TaxID=182803 RepID=A0A4Y2KWP9_ARAVE|nr:hypothetical protein AVEN_88101-1 [Araneus ventricosus]
MQKTEREADEVFVDTDKGKTQLYLFRLIFANKFSIAFFTSFYTKMYCSCTDQTALSRFVSGHLRSYSFSHGNKVFPVCAKCGVASASPEHILSCLRLSRETFETGPLLALDFLRVSGLMDGV